MADEETPKESKEKLPAKPMTAVSASGSHAVVVAQPAPPPGPALPQISRRQMVVGGFWTAITGLTAITVAALVNFMWPRQAQKAGGVFTLDVNANDIPVGERREYVILQPSKSNPLQSIETKLYLVHLNEEQAQLNLAPDKAGAYLALSRKCPHLGCTVPYVESFTFPDPDNGQQPVTGWFRCPCHGSTYSDSGRRVFGPAPRSMDLFALTIAEDGTMSVDLSAGIQGATEVRPDNPGNISHAVRPGETPA
jgi:cytochrome b6-f complex iron-sulfur subunit